MFKYKVKIRMDTYEGTKWMSTTVFAENVTECEKKVEREYRLHNCLDYYINMKEMAVK